MNAMSRFGKMTTLHYIYACMTHNYACMYKRRHFIPVIDSIFIAQLLVFIFCCCFLLSCNFFVAFFSLHSPYSSIMRVCIIYLSSGLLDTCFFVVVVIATHMGFCCCCCCTDCSIGDANMAAAVCSYTLCCYVTDSRVQ